MAVATVDDSAVHCFPSEYGSNSADGVQFMAQMASFFFFTGIGTSPVAPGSSVDEDDDDDDNEDVSLATRL